MLQEKNPRELKNIWMVGPGTDIDPETVELFKVHDNGLLIGDGSANKPLMWQDVIDKVDNRPFAPMPNFYILAHGVRGPEGEHRMSLGNTNRQDLYSTEDWFKKIIELVGGPVCIHFYSCFGGSANKAAKALGEGSILITHIEAKEFSAHGLDDYRLHASLKRNFARNLLPHQQFILDLQENFETATFTRVESDSKSTQFKSIRIPKEKEMANIIAKMEKKQNLTDYINEFLAEEGARFQKVFPELDITQEIKEVSTLDDKDVNIFLLGTLNHLCKFQGDLNIKLLDSFLKKLLNHGISLDSQDKYGGYTPLHFAAYFGNSKIVKILVENGANLNLRDHDGRTPLHCAAFEGKFEIVKILVEKEPTLKNLVDTGDTGYTPLQCAIIQGHLPIVQFLIEKKANVHLQDNDGYTALHLAAINGKIDVIKLLIEKEPKLKNLVNTGNTGYTALQCAIIKEDLPIVKFIIEKKANVHLQDNNGNTALHWAMETKNIEIIKILIENGAKLDVSNKLGKTPLQLAPDYGIDIDKILREKKTKPELQANNDSNTPLPLVISAAAPAVPDHLATVEKQDLQNVKLRLIEYLCQEMGDKETINTSDVNKMKKQVIKILAPLSNDPTGSDTKTIAGTIVREAAKLAGKKLDFRQQITIIIDKLLNVFLNRRKSEFKDILKNQEARTALKSLKKSGVAPIAEIWSTSAPIPSNQRQEIRGNSKTQNR